ncbi:O-antigen ligase [Kineosporia sp. R_H_3]|uniref:O-antigen ligase family protein n=1 Tax=Kineosporia sp. R_H_3 TaxID=1961848 RepID=UPI000B4ABD2C|nr:O-antigen ligase family protein [Kineosporia sp. R_H_3]
MLQATPRGRLRVTDPVATYLTVGTLVVAGLAGYLAVSTPRLASLLVVAPVLLWLLAQRVFAITVLAVTLPYVADLSGGVLGVNMALSDLLMTFLVLGLVFEWVLTNRADELRALSPLKGVVGQYLAVLTVLLVAHPEFAVLVATGQRVELFVFPLLVGALVARTGRELWFLRAYIVASAVTGALWIAGVELGQKNPIGQFVANALILLLAVKPLRPWLQWLTPLLVAGLLWTQSRGAILSVGVALAVLVLAQPGSRSRLRSLALSVPVAVTAYVVFRLLPEEAQERNLTYTSGNETAGEWAIKIREQYHADAWSLIHAHPWTGVGVGKYLAGNPYEGNVTDDPHQVLLLEGATGGYLLMGSFVVLVLGALWVGWRTVRRTELGPAALALTAAIVGHGLVDVYWVRGTPVLGWLVLGMALAQRRRPGAAPEQSSVDVVRADVPAPTVQEVAQ